MPMKMTFERLKIVKALETGPKSWSVLRVAYYGEERAKSPASTSFNNQLHRMMEGGAIKKIGVGYALAKEEEPCFRCNTLITDGMYCEGCKEDLRAAGRPTY